MDVPYSPTSLSACKPLRTALAEALPGVKTYPVLLTAQAATLPYVVIRRESTEILPQKGTPAVDHTAVTVECYAKDYDGSVDMAERCRAALDGHSGAGMRSCYYRDSREDYDSGAFVQILTFEVKI